jgi:hypothetical protein
VTEAEIQEHIDVLLQLEQSYRLYVAAYERGDQAAVTALRPDLLKRSSRAQRAVSASGVRFALTPPPMFGGPPLTSLTEQLFAFERPGWDDVFGYDHVPRAAQLVLDGLAAAVGSLEDQLDQVRRGPPPQTVKSKSPKERHAPRLLIGRIRALPAAVGFLADLAALGLVLVAIAKAAGFW